MTIDIVPGLRGQLEEREARLYGFVWQREADMLVKA